MIKVYSISPESIDFDGVIPTHGEIVIKDKINDVGEMSFYVENNEHNRALLDLNKMVTWKNHAAIVQSMSYSTGNKVIDVACVSLEAILSWRYVLGSFDAIYTGNTAPTGSTAPVNLKELFDRSFGKVDFLSDYERRVYLDRLICWKLPIDYGEWPVADEVVAMRCVGITLFDALKEFCRDKYVFKIKFNQKTMKMVMSVSPPKSRKKVIHAGDGMVQDVTYTRTYSDVVNLLQFVPADNYGNDEWNRKIQNINWRGINDPTDPAGYVRYGPLPLGMEVRCGWADIESYRDGIIKSNYNSDGNYMWQNAVNVLNSQMTRMSVGFNNRQNQYSCTIYNLDIETGDKIRLIDSDYGIDREMLISEIEYHIDANDNWFSLVDLSDNF